jgi:transposase
VASGDDAEEGELEALSNARRPTRSRRSFTDEFKAGAVRLVLDEGTTMAQVARDLDLAASVLGRGSDTRRRIGRMARRA